jgi:Uncharacterised nucleotidyltransferase
MLAGRPGETADSVREECRRRFIALASRHRRAAAIREKCVDELLTSFANAGVPIILLKGAALAHLIYPNPALRPMIDIDILVEPAEIGRAARIVRTAGFSFASGYESRFAGRMHHLPAATITRSGFRISLEIHRDAISSDQSDSITFTTLVEKPRPFKRGAGPDGVALGHIDMLRHLARHAFLPARQVRLIHLYDLWRYRAKFQSEIDWQRLAARFPDVAVKLRLVDYVFASPERASGREAVPTGVGYGMVPLAEIADAGGGLAPKLAALFNPPGWWIHGFYGIPPERSLLICRCVHHPLTVGRWLARRLVASLGSTGRDADLGDPDREDCVVKIKR